MTPSPILKVLSSIQSHGVRHLLMGGQACVLYGAAEFSRDADLVVQASPPNLERLRQALADLRAERIAVPPFEARFLQSGHAVHFRCRHPDASNVRVDVMSKMRGLGEFQSLWDRRTTIELGSQILEVISLADLVQAKKTQRDKDWPMLTRLLEAHYFEHRREPRDEQVAFWLRELRTPSLLVEVKARFPQVAREIAKDRPLLAWAVPEEEQRLEQALREEEARERDADRAYWKPLKAELEELRRSRPPRQEDAT